MIPADTSRESFGTCWHLSRKLFTPADTCRTFFVTCVVCMCARVSVFFTVSLQFVGCIVWQAL